MRRVPPGLLVAGVAAVGFLLVAGTASASGGTPPARRLGIRMDTWISRVLARVSRHEGRFDSLNLNRDGAGLSMGILQWSQKPGQLGVLLAEMQKADPETFSRVFGPAWRELLATTNASSSAARLVSVDGEVLWKEPWVGRFRTAGKSPVFQDVQRRLAVQGRHFQGAVEVARYLNVASERAMALFFDTSVQQGPRGAMRVAERVKAHFEKQGQGTVSYEDLLATYARFCASPFRTTTEPTKPYPSSHIEWRKTGDEWHAWAGAHDLYTGITRRRTGILKDPDLTDTPIALA